MPTVPAGGIQGIQAAAVTPRRPSGHQIDIGATLEVVDFLCENGVQGIVLLGSTGEFLHFDYDDRARLGAMAVKRSRAPVFINVSHSTFDGAIRLAEDAKGAGAAGLLLMPPYYFEYEQNEIQEFFLRFAAEVGHRTPIYLYNIPCFTNDMACETSMSLLATGLFEGIKDSSGRFEDFVRFQEMRSQHQFRLLLGADTLYARARHGGADGAVSGIASAVPELLVALERCIASGDASKEAILQQRLEEFAARIDCFPTPFGIKAAGGARGLKTGSCAVPLSADRRKELDSFLGWFREWLPGVQQECR
jgi:4-hydroxy-tetrahydrodipicolinate synthase